MKPFNLTNPLAAKRPVVLSISLAMITSMLAACGNTGSSVSTSAPSTVPSAATTASAAPAATTASTAPKALVPATVVLNWFAEPEHGGNFAASAKGYYKDAGFDMTLMPGGPQVSSTQIVASGKAQFGMANGDDILVARQEGIPVVAIATSMQKSPQALFYHKSSGIKDFSDLNGHKVYVASTASFWQFMKKKYKLDTAQEMKYTGQLVNFVNDKTSLTQGYVTSEPFTLDQQKVEYGTLLNADSGYNIYAGVYFTTEKMIAEHPDQVKAFVEATVKGWDYYKDHSDEINPAIQVKNPDMGLDMMKYSAAKEMDFVFGGDAATKGTGIMTKERWTEVQKQLVDVGVLKTAENIDKVFTTQFLPKK
ncbi:MULTISPECIES: ABC transporter substrate-binding protein [unclassified Paenibacillus]|uniref:ABC transporter substrate-binding protein n=1 Tax=unclassified Paenibacillus TaxID=185978 RepID=UPI00277E4B76|nr:MULTISPECIES: ABC transporter substrate-binding protein [unclassified Paenibacillus]MDF2645752.1 myristoyl transferase [Paenibacillus sp.]MDQ0896930.1 NitT/TauT family transport system substrate-binding protein [Paenibacillus sp. V4I7]MDQ0916922.1 NitT/TauT family transport system substrate-binding protein [Paenibacillus sp. V4I5]